LDAFALIFCAAVPPQIALAIDMLLRDFVAAAAVLCCQLRGTMLPRCVVVVVVGVGLCWRWTGWLPCLRHLKGLAKFRWEKKWIC
jgi:hypothetical protein